MTTETNPGDGLSCRRCSFLNRAGDQFCAHCGHSIADLPATAPVSVTPPQGRPTDNGGPGPDSHARQRDATTRYLCAAAHLDPAFSNDAIAEFLVEPVRALPPAPGVDSVAVLRDAVAARARRRLRDAILLVLLVILAFVSLPALMAWLILALITFMVRRRGAPRTPLNIVIFAFLILAGIALLPSLLGITLINALPNDFAGVLPEVSSGLVTIVLIALAVIAVDEFTVHYLVYTSFRRNQFTPDARHAASSWERAVRSLGTGALQAPLARVAAADERAAQHPDLSDVIVHRGFSPFIGAGNPVAKTIVAMKLEPAEDSYPIGDSTRQEPREINVVELQQHVANAISDLRSSSSLGPSGRFTGLTEREQVLMTAYRLTTNLDTRLGSRVLPDLYHPPAAQLPVDTARHLADVPEEWARYYRCYRIEAWDRDLTTSCYLHAGTDQRMLFLEWTFCILPPIRSSYRRIDRLKNPVIAPLSRSLAELVTLPAAIITRFRSVFRRFDPLPQREGEIVPDRYGAARSLREIAADDDVQNYFQDVDSQRYVKILDAMLIRAVGEYLEDHGYSVVEFLRQAVPVINQTLNNISGGTFYGSALGSGNTVQNTAGQPAPPKGKP